LDAAYYRMTAYLEEDRVPVVRTDFKSDGACLTRLVGSTPALFRHPPSLILAKPKFSYGVTTPERAKRMSRRSFSAGGRLKREKFL
jgi:hypothetical protein